MLFSSKLSQLLLIWVILASFTSISIAYTGGSGTQADPYQIATAADLIQLGNTTTDYDKCFIMTADIDLAGQSFTRAVIYNFSGVFDGCGHTISNFSIGSTEINSGLFGVLTSNAKVSRLGLNNIQVTSESNFVGGLCGHNQGVISGCFASGKIVGNSSVGGLCGSNNYGKITNSYATGSVSGYGAIGGLCGRDSSNGGVTFCYATSVVTAATEGKGGVIGVTIMPYSTYSLWDMAVSGLEVYSSFGFAAMETAEMQEESIYQKRGWDFSDSDGDVADWKLVSGYYPVLVWETPVLISVPVLAGLTQSQAEEALAGLGLEVIVRTGYDSQYPAGQVCAQSITGKTKQSSTVILYISSGNQKYSGGSGIIAAPYQIASKDDLINLGANTADYGKCFILTSDIDMASAGTFNKAVIAWDTDPATTYFEGTVFTGRFNGCGHKIANLKISGQSCIGLFGSTTLPVKNLGLVNVSISGSGSNVGGICGYSDLGKMSGIYRCYVTGSVSGNGSVGGLAGGGGGFYLEECYNNANVTSIMGNAGGLCGFGSSVVRCYNLGAISGGQYVGGLCGSIGTITDSYSTGPVTGSGSSAGGLCGSVGVISNSFWDKQNSGRAVAVGSGSVSGATGLDTVDMKKQTTFTDAGWDFSTDDGDAAEWQMKVNSYPLLDWQMIAGDFVWPYSGGSGTEADPYKIAKAQDLIDLGNNVSDYDKYFIMTADIDLAGRSFTKSVIAPDVTLSSSYTGRFAGVFNGNGHTINNLTINAIGLYNYNESYSVGLFGATTTTAEIFDLGVVNVNISSKYYVCTGGLCGESLGKIYRCFTTGFVSDNNGYSTGGLCGSIGYNSTGVVSVRNCYSTCSVIGSMNFAGLIGENWRGNISNCYATGFISRQSAYTDSQGGKGELCGVFTTNQAVLENSFWDVETGFLRGTGKGTAVITNTQGKTTAQMQDISTFTSAGWDFTTDDGDAADWKILPGCYPALSWETLVSVPDVSGMTVDQARETLVSNGFTVVTSNVASELPAGTMVAISPNGTVRPTTPMTLYVSNGTKKYAGGSGIAKCPYKISTADELVLLGNTSADYDKHFILTNDIDMAGRTFTKSVIAFGTISSGTFNYNAIKFSGKFDGNGYSISNLKISITGATSVGLFGCLDAGAVVKNLNLTNVNISGIECVGSLCSINNYGFIKNCSSSGTVIGSYLIVGGLCGKNYGWLDECRTSGAVKGGNDVGGVCGASSFMITNSLSSCSVTDTDMSSYDANSGSGGLCGSNTGEISDSSATGDVSCDRYAGGLCGNNSGKISDSFATGLVNCTVNSGGFCGRNYTGSITNCYATGSVIGTGTIIGGLCGRNDSGSISNCYATGVVVGSDSGYVGGLCGLQYSSDGVIKDCFWDTDTSAKTVGIGYVTAGIVTNVQGKTTAQMQEISTFTAAGWDFSAADGDGADWQMKAGCYPLLDWQVLDGDIAGSNAIDLEDLEYLATNWLSDTAVADLDGDATINMADFAVLAGNWLASN